MFSNARFSLVLVFVLAGAWFLSGCAGGTDAAGVPGGSPAASSSEADAPRFRVLVFSKTEGFRHASIPDGKRAIQQLGAEHDFAVDTTENAAAFTEDTLARYDAVVFLNTTGDVLDAGQQRAFRSYVEAGGGFAGVHAAADTEYDWPWYGRLVGAYFESHPSNPNVRPATVRVTDRSHPSTQGLSQAWERTDEWYNYRSNPRDSVRVLATVDESTYGGGTMGADHPIVWKHTRAGGPAWYTGGGHTKDNYTEPLFREHLLGGIEWAAGAAP
jgi:type 1 glutamine amidotransferase